MRTMGAQWGALQDEMLASHLACSAQGLLFHGHRVSGNRGVPSQILLQTAGLYADSTPGLKLVGSQLRVKYVAVMQGGGTVE